MNNRELARRIIAQRESLNFEDALVEALDAKDLMSYPGTPKVHGYQPQSDAKVALVNRFKEMEERLLRELDAMYGQMVPNPDPNHPAAEVAKYDMRWAAVARTHFQEGFMALNRAVFQPQRIKLPEDDAEYKMTAYGRRPDGSIGDMTPEEYAAAVQRDLP